MQRNEEIAASSWLKETQKGYIRVATLILISAHLQKKLGATMKRLPEFKDTRA
jgi:hypothetical protein